MRRPTSGGEGLVMRPSRTSRNCSHTPSEVGTSTGSQPSFSLYCASKKAPQAPVRNIPSVPKTRISEAQEGEVLPQALSVTNVPERSRAMTTPVMSTGRP